MEIQDVKISSATLFKNLQTEFRERSRLDAERISAEINMNITKENIERKQKMDKNEYLASMKT